VYEKKYFRNSPRYTPKSIEKQIIKHSHYGNKVINRMNFVYKLKIIIIFCLQSPYLHKELDKFRSPKDLPPRPSGALDYTPHPSKNCNLVNAYIPESREAGDNCVVYLAYENNHVLVDVIKKKNEEVNNEGNLDEMGENSIKNSFELLTFILESKSNQQHKRPQTQATKRTWEEKNYHTKSTLFVELPPLNSENSQSATENVLLLIVIN
jgi:hypothetical protein